MRCLTLLGTCAKLVRRPKRGPLRRGEFVFGSGDGMARIGAQLRLTRLETAPSQWASTPFGHSHLATTKAPIIPANSATTNAAPRRSNAGSRCSSSS
jgi:hypothetical protein